jgi:hypothetical protein
MNPKCSLLLVLESDRVFGSVINQTHTAKYKVKNISQDKLGAMPLEPGIHFCCSFIIVHHVNNVGFSLVLLTSYLP